MTRTRTRQVGAMLVAGAMLSAGALVGAAPTAGASGDVPTHMCNFFIGNTDEGPLTDPIHHGLEPLVPELHPVSCQIQQTLDGISCHYLPALAFLRSPRPLGC